MLVTIILVTVALVGGFIAGVLVGRANSKTVTAVITDVKSTITSLETKVTSLEAAVKATTPAPVAKPAAPVAAPAPAAK